LDSQPLNFQSVGIILCIEGKKLYRWYKEVLSGFLDTEQQVLLHKYDTKEKDKDKKEHPVQVPILKVENLGAKMCIDEKHIGDHMYTILSNRESGKIAMVACTLKVATLTKILENFGDKKFEVKSISRDLSESFNWVCRQSFMNATHVADKFHVLCHLFDASQDMRVFHRQKVLSQRRILFDEFQKKEFERAGQCMKDRKKFIPQEFLFKEPRLANGETLRELLARSRYLLYKFQNQWTQKQQERAEVLFEKYPDLKVAYDLSGVFRNWYSKLNIGEDKNLLLSELHRWYRLVEKTGIEELLNFKSLVERNQSYIMNYFNIGESNAMAEGINSRIQQFIHPNKGVRDKDFFFFRLAKFYA
jgi:transposase